MKEQKLTPEKKARKWQELTLDIVQGNHLKSRVSYVAIKSPTNFRFRLKFHREKMLKWIVLPDKFGHFAKK